MSDESSAARLKFDVRVFREGVGKVVDVTWGNLSIDGASDWDRSPMFLDSDGGSVRVSAVDGDGNIMEVDGATVLDRSWKFPYKSWWGYENVPTSAQMELPWSAVAMVRIAVSCTFSWVEYALEDGTSRRDENVFASGVESVLYRQPDDSRSYGSANVKQLFWPFKDVR